MYFLFVSSKRLRSSSCSFGIEPSLSVAQSCKRRPPTTEVKGSSPVSNISQGKLEGWVRINSLENKSGKL